MFYAVSAVALSLLLQYGLTFLQIKHYRNTLRNLREMYHDQHGWLLCSGHSRRLFRKGALVFLVVDAGGRVKDCRALVGRSVFSQFRPAPEWNGRHVLDLLSETHEIRLSKNYRTTPRCLVDALGTAAERAVHMMWRRQYTELGTGGGIRPEKTLDLSEEVLA